MIIVSLTYGENLYNLYHSKYLIPFNQTIRQLNDEIYAAMLLPSISNNLVFNTVSWALDIINNSSIILKNKKLKVVYTITECKMPKATEQFLNIMNSSMKINVIFGCGCPELTGALSEISSFWNVTQITYSDTDSTLSAKNKYPNLIRAVVSDYCFNYASISLLKWFNWTKIGILYQDEVSYLKTSSHSMVNAHLVHEMEKNGYKPYNFGFIDDPSPSLKNLKMSNIRIILGNFHKKYNEYVFCKAHKERMVGRNYVWILFGQGHSSDNQINKEIRVNCDRNVILQYHIALDYLEFWNEENSESISNLTAREYKKKINSESMENSTNIFHAYVFDALWGVALAIHSGESFSNTFNKVVFPEFFGITGPFKITKGERNCLINIKQYIDGKYNYIGYFSELEDHVKIKNDSLIWAHGQIPSDRSKTDHRWESINIIVYIIFIVITSCGIVFAFILMGINIAYRKHRYIKMSSPNMNNIIIVGSIFSYLSVIFLGTDRSKVGDSKFVMKVICSMKAWTLCLGFTLSFGAMFSKTWRVHQIFTNISLNKKVIKDSKLIGMVCFLLLLDIIILSIQPFIDPVQLKVQNYTMVQSDQDVEVTYSREFCSSDKQSVWVGVIYAHKGLLLVIGGFLVWETRQVNIPALNDSKHIGLSVYMVVIMCASGATVNAVIQDRIDFNFMIIASFIILCTTITLCLVFLPKLIQIRNDPKGVSIRKHATIKKGTKYSNDCPKAQNMHTETIIKDLLLKKLSEIEKTKMEMEKRVNEIRKKHVKKKTSLSNVFSNLKKKSMLSATQLSDEKLINSSKSSVTFFDQMDCPDDEDYCKAKIIINKTVDLDYIDYSMFAQICRNLPETTL